MRYRSLSVAQYTAARTSKNKTYIKKLEFIT